MIAHIIICPLSGSQTPEMSRMGENYNEYQSLTHQQATSFNLNSTRLVDVEEGQVIFMQTMVVSGIHMPS